MFKYTFSYKFTRLHDLQIAVAQESQNDMLVCNQQHLLALRRLTTILPPALTHLTIPMMRSQIQSPKYPTYQLELEDTCQDSGDVVVNLDYNGPLNHILTKGMLRCLRVHSKDSKELRWNLSSSVSVILFVITILIFIISQVIDCYLILLEIKCGSLGLKNGFLSCFFMSALLQFVPCTNTFRGFHFDQRKTHGVAKGKF